MSETNAFDPVAQPSQSRDAVMPSRAMVAWCVWMVANLGALALFAARVPLAAKMPAPLEDGALIGVSVTAMIVACCLAPLLLATWRSAVIAIASMAPLFVLAALLAGDRAGTAIGPIALASVWLLAMAALCQRRHPLAIAIVSALLLVVGVGAPILWYFAIEFAERAPDGFGWLASISPTQGVLATVLHEPSPQAGAPSVSGLVIEFAGRFAVPMLILLADRTWAFAAPRFFRPTHGG